jgi:hypothetical protein
MKIKRTKKQIDKVYSKASKYEGTFSGDTYEMGVMNTLEWITGKTKWSPMKGVKSVLNPEP